LVAVSLRDVLLLLLLCLLDPLGTVRHREVLRLDLRRRRSRAHTHSREAVYSCVMSGGRHGRVRYAEALRVWRRRDRVRRHDRQATYSRFRLGV
jgi:hypothetical protein